jgi:hypothetical protein
MSSGLDFATVRILGLRSVKFKVMQSGVSRLPAHVLGVLLTSFTSKIAATLFSISLTPMFV